MNWQLCPQPPCRIREELGADVFLSFDLPATEKQGIIYKKKKNWRFLPFILLRSSLPRSTWNTTRVLDNYRATSLLFFVKLNFGWSVGTAIAVLYSIKPLQSNWDWVKNDWSSVTVDPPSTRALEYLKTTWDGSLVYLHCVVWVGFGMGWAGQDGEGWRLHCYVLINHVSILVWSKLCVCMAELG